MSKRKFTTSLQRAQSITFVELLSTISIAMLLVSIIILFEVKTSFFSRYLALDPQIAVAPNVQRMVLSNVDIDALTEFATDHPELAAVGVVSVDFAENKRSPIIVIYNDKELERLHVATNYNAPAPLFSMDTALNAEFTLLLNGQFTCTAPPKTMAQQDGFEKPMIKTTCRVPVPPYYGRLTGYLVFHSKHELSIYDVDQLRKVALRLAIDMYYSNVSSVVQLGKK